MSSSPSCDVMCRRALAHEALSSSPVWRRDRHVVRLRTRPYCRCPSGDATGMSCACARGLIVVARLATRPACRALAHKALLLLPVWQRDRHVVRLRTRPYRRRLSGDATGMLCTCTRGLVTVAAVRRNVLSCACAQGLVAVAAVRRDVLLCACAQGLVAVAVARRDVSTARAHAHEGRW